MILKATIVMVWFYLIAGSVSLLLVPTSAFGWFGLKPDPLSAVFATLLSLPWSLAMNFVENPSPIAGLGIMTFGIIMNVLVLYSVYIKLKAQRETKY